MAAELKVAVRVDASAKIGTGHFMRCLTLADALRERGARTRFISRHLPEHLQLTLTALGHELVRIDTHQNDVILDELAHASWLGVSQAHDATDSIRALSDQNWDWLIVDHYALDSRWESMLRQSAKKILVIDDIADRQHDCDMLLDQNIYTDMETRYGGKAPAHCQLLLGPRYALLRDEFRRLHERVMPRNGSVKRALLFFGGVDAENFTGFVINALTRINITGIHFDVVIGVQHPCREQIEALCMKHGFVYHLQTNKMAELMEAADFAIGAGGSACWERCALGVPSLVVALANNQINIAMSLDSIGACIYAGTSEMQDVDSFGKAITTLLDDDRLLKQISIKALSLVDGLGADRILQKMKSSK